MLSLVLPLLLACRSPEDTASEGCSSPEVARTNWALGQCQWYACFYGEGEMFEGDSFDQERCIEDELFSYDRLAEGLCIDTCTVDDINERFLGYHGELGCDHRPGPSSYGFYPCEETPPSEREGYEEYMECECTGCCV